MVNLNNYGRNLVRNDDGIWQSSTQSAISYPENGNALCLEVEDHSFWFNHRNSCITELIKAFPPKNNGIIFDVGGGNGFVSAACSNAGFQVVLVEPGLAGAQTTRKRGLNHVVCSSLDDAGFKPGCLPAVGLFDVVEHIEDDSEFLQTIHTLLSENGKLYITVPAYSFLWSGEDVTAGHFRRYSLRSITRILEAANFKIDFSTYIFRFLPLPILLMRSLPYWIGGKVARQHGSIRRVHAAGSSTGRLMTKILLASEQRNVKKGKQMVFGGSCLLAATKA